MLDFPKSLITRILLSHQEKWCWYLIIPHAISLHFMLVFGRAPELAGGGDRG
jgi:hypothetical protein